MNLMLLCVRPSWTAMCHYSYCITDGCPRLSVSHLLLFLTPALSFYLHPYHPFFFNSFLSFVRLYRGGAPRFSQHQHVPLLAGLWRGLGDGPSLQLAPWESPRHQECGKCLRRWNNIDCYHDSFLWPLHVHGQQQTGLQFSHLHCRYEFSVLLHEMNLRNV